MAPKPSVLSPPAFERLVIETLTRWDSLRQNATVLDLSDPASKIDAQNLHAILSRNYNLFLEKVAPYRELAEPLNDLPDDVFLARLEDVHMGYQNLSMLLGRFLASNPPLSDLPQTPNLPTPLPPALPSLSPPTFSGNPVDWDNFFSRFCSLIHSNKLLTPLQKFQFLLNSLDPASTKLIGHLTFSEHNYEVAIKILVQRFDNPRRSIAHYTSQLLNLPTLNSTSVRSLSNFLDTFSVAYQALTALPDIDPHEAFLSSYLLSRFDSPSLIKFESSRGPYVTSYPKVEELRQFLFHQVRARENVVLISSKDNKPSSKTTVLATSVLNTDSKVSIPPKHIPSEPSRFNLPSSSSKPPSFICSFCAQPGHKVYVCKEFLKLTPHQRFSWIKEKKFCSNCLGSHLLVFCSSKFFCSVCQRKHHTLLHFPSAMPKPTVANAQPLPTSLNTSPLVKPEISRVPGQAKTSPSPQAKFHLPQPSSSTPGVPALLSNNIELPTVLLATCLIRVQVSRDNYVILRAVLDSAAGASFVNESALKILNPLISSHSISVTGVNRSKSQTLGACSLSLTTLAGQPLVSDHLFHITSSISTTVPSIRISPEVRRAACQLRLADPSFDTPSPVECILGADLMALLLTGDAPLSLGINMPYAIPTVYGYVLMGSTPPDPTLGRSPHSSSLCSLPCYYTQTTSPLHSLLEKFWLLEEPPSSSSSARSEEDQFCETFYASTVLRDSSGRYQVRLPLLPSDTVTLGDSFKFAYARFLSLERHFSRNPAFKQLYVDFMQDYLDQGHMCLASGPTYYFIPHHGVFKNRGDTSKIRVVFNASVPSSSGYSLNDNLSTGPKLQTLIPDVLTLFRQYPYVFVADVKQMFRQINIHPSDYPYQCILWRADPSEPLRTYYLTTVTYGTRPAPYLAIRTMRQLAQDESSRFPNASRVLMTNIFVDDLLVGAPTLTDALNLRDELICLLLTGGFTLSKWIANHPQLLPSLPTDSLSDSSAPIEPTKLVLGVPWDPSTDKFQLTFSPQASDSPLTKRMVCSLVAQLYDPCGWASPLVFAAKCFLQQLWTLNADWDTPLGTSFTALWQTLLSSLSSAPLNCLRPFPACTSYVLHGFADASQKGFAAVIYLVAGDSPHSSPSLLTSKTKVAPLRTLSIPRLELCGALLLAELSIHYSTLLSSSLCIREIHLWTDSQIVLHWLKLESRRLKTFVGNRVSQIQTLTSSCSWHHVPSSDNPADIASRGSSASQLVDCELWWSGPSWLVEPPSTWPPTPPSIAVSSSDLELLPSTTPVLASQPTSPDIFIRLSSWSKIFRVTRLILRWRYRRSSYAPSYSHILNCLCYYIQQQSFPDEIKQLTRGTTFPSRLKRLTPFLDSLGLIRVGGRLQNSQFCLIQHPILLPKNHRLVLLLIDHFHISYCHAGLSFLHAQLFSKLWILCGRQVIRSRIFKCITCFRSKPSNTPPPMGQLPSMRVNPSPPFLHTGMDFAGPFLCKASLLRKAPQLKVYLCIFVCMSTKAVHLELASDLSTAAFLDVLQRFISRRGLPTTLYSDCGTNFVGSAAVLRKSIKQFFADPSVGDVIKTSCCDLGIDFHFNPPYAPHQGGLWERAIRSTKFHLVRVLGAQIPTWMVLNSLIIKIESILNSRPISTLSSDPSDLQALTPGHFLIGRPLTTIPGDDFTHFSGCPRHLHLLQSLQRSFWNRWKRDYLPSLSVHSKWTQPSSEIAVGDVVVLEEPKSPPLSWPLAKVSSIYPGADGVVRRLEVITPSGRYLRPATKVYKLPVM